MTALSQPQPRSAFPAGLVLLALLAVLALGILGVADHVRTNAAHTAHHGDVVEQIHTCLDSNGPAHVLKSRSWRQPNTRFLTCEYAPGEWGLMIAERAKNGWREITTFRVKSGTWGELWEYLSARGVMLP